MENWYVIFVKTGYELCVRDNFKKLFGSEQLIIPFVPMVERLIKLPGIIKKEIVVMFPGYLFIDTNIDSIEFYKLIKQVQQYVQEIMQILRYGTTFDILIKYQERKILDELLNRERCLEMSRGYMKGDLIYVTEGPLAGRESIIWKVDRHKRKAIILMELLGAQRQVTVALDIIQKIV